MLGLEPNVKLLYTGGRGVQYLMRRSVLQWGDRPPYSAGIVAAYLFSYGLHGCGPYSYVPCGIRPSCLVDRAVDLRVRW